MSSNNSKIDEMQTESSPKCLKIAATNWSNENWNITEMSARPYYAHTLLWSTINTSYKKLQDA